MSISFAAELSHTVGRTVVDQQMAAAAASVAYRSAEAQEKPGVRRDKSVRGA
jgi:hypothetical protein